MPIDMVSAVDIEPFEHLRLAIVGAEKSGKSRLASTGRKEVLFLDFDQRKESIAKIAGVHAISFRDAAFPNTPDAAPICLSVMSALEQSLDLSKLSIIVPGLSGEKKAFPNLKPETMVKTIVFDSIFSMAECFRRYALATNKDLRREISFGTTKVYMVNGWDSWNAETGATVPIIMRALALGVDVILILHEMLEQSEDSTDENPKFTGRTSVYPRRYQQILKNFNEVWRMKLTQVPVLEDNKTVYKFIPRVYPLPDAQFNAASALLIGAVEEPNIEAIIARHLAKAAAIKPK